MRFEGSEAAQELQSVLKDNYTAHDVMTLVKFAKHVRLRCRNNAAFNNYMNRLFDGQFTFQQVTKQGPRGTYPGLKIECVGGGHAVESGDEDE